VGDNWIAQSGSYQIMRKMGRGIKRKRSTDGEKRKEGAGERQRDED
jgi:hypothetical protein